MKSTLLTNDYRYVVRLCAFLAYEVEFFKEIISLLTPLLTILLSIKLLLARNRISALHIQKLLDLSFW